MTAHNKEGVQWRQTSVLIRADIFAQVHEQGLNISHECNRALADLVGIDYQQQQLPEETPKEPVITAPDEKTGRATAGSGKENRSLRPVLNADDPKTPARVLQLKKDLVALKSHQDRTISSGSGQKKQQDPSPPSDQPVSLPRSRKKEKTDLAKRKGRETAIKRFVSTRVVRTDAESSDGGVVPKDEMYQRFVRWCRANSVSPVPDKRSFSVALKNRFVFRETTVNNVACWVNVAMK